MVHEPEDLNSLDRLDNNDVAQIIESIQEAQYFDADSMTPLTPASLVRKVFRVYVYKMP